MGDPACHRAICPNCDAQATIVDERCPECDEPLDVE